MLIYLQLISHGYRQGNFSGFQYIHLTDFYDYFIFLRRENASKFLKFLPHVGLINADIQEFFRGEQ